MSNNWKVGLCEGSVRMCCYATWCRCCAYADLAEATGAIPLGMTRKDACYSFAFSTTWDRLHMILDVMTRIRHLKGIKERESGCGEFCTIICCSPCVFRQMLTEMEEVQVVEGVAVNVVTKQPESFSEGQAIIKA